MQHKNGHESMANSPIFIVSPLNRSGTNYLARLLQEVGELEIPKGINEDYLCVYSDMLRDYVNQTTRHWSKPYRDPEHPIISELMNGFGEVLLSSLRSKTSENKGMLLKCPRANNINNVFSLFPSARVIVCIRDGRDTIESFVRSFNQYSFKTATKLWVEGCEAIQKLQAQHQSDKFSNQILTIKYEDIFSHDTECLSAISSFCNLAEGTLTAEVIADLPIFGSSTNRGATKDLNWDPVTKTTEFQPLGRWNSWGWRKKIMFKAIAGDMLVQMGSEQSNKW